MIGAYARYLKYREMIREGAFGGPVFVRVNDVREVRPKVAMHQPQVNGGPVIDLDCHLLDIMRFITGREAAGVYSLSILYESWAGSRMPAVASP